MSQTPNDDITLYDLFKVLRKWAVLILALPIVFALVALILSLLLPKTYITTVVISLSLSNQSNQGLLNNLPSLAGLSQGFVDLQSTRLLANQLEVANPTRFYNARFDDKRGLLFLAAKGQTSAEARERAERILQVARSYFERNLLEGAQANLRAALTQTRLDLQAARDSLRLIQAQLRLAPDRAVSNPTIAAGLEARGTDPQAARTPNPAFTSLSLDESRMRSQVAQLEARINTLTEFIKQPDSIGQLVSQALLVQVLVPPAEPLRPSFPRPLLFTVIAGVLGLFFGIFWAFLSEAIRPRPEPTRPDAALLEAREKTSAR